jgi:hypothetical protein
MCSFYLSHTIDKNVCHCEEYDLDEQDIRWLVAYNQFRIERGNACLLI